MSHELQADSGVLWAAVKAMGSLGGLLGSSEGHGFLCFLFLPSGRQAPFHCQCLPYTKYSLLLIVWGGEVPRPPALVLSCNVQGLFMVWFTTL